MSVHTGLSHPQPKIQNSTDHHDQPPTTKTKHKQVKRLRLCVADNEAMRAAFSLLRVREADEGELVRMLGTWDFVVCGCGFGVCDV